MRIAGVLLHETPRNDTANMQSIEGFWLAGFGAGALRKDDGWKRINMPAVLPIFQKLIHGHINILNNLTQKNG